MSSILDLQLNNLNILGIDIEPASVKDSAKAAGKKDPNAHECVLMLIAEMMAKHEKADKNMQLSPNQVLSQFIEEALASAIEQAEQEAMAHGSLGNSFDAIKNFLDRLAAHAGGISDEGLRNYVLAAAHNIDAYKDDPNILKELATIRAQWAEYQHDQRNYERAKKKHDPIGMGKWKLAETKLATKMGIKFKDVTNYKKVEAFVNNKINVLNNALNAKRKDFLLEMGNDATITAQRAARNIDMSKADIADQNNDTKAELGIIQAFATIINNSQ